MFRLSGLLGFLILSSLSAAHAQTYSFITNSSASGLAASVKSGVAADGTLIGNYDAGANPGGTRTKPGLFGTFGSTENVSVPLSISSQIDTNISSRPAGSCYLGFDLSAGTVAMTGYQANLIASGPVTIPATITLQWDNFRTQSPSSTFPGGIPVSSSENVLLTELGATQSGSASGTLTQTDTNKYSFTLYPLLAISAKLNVVGSDYVSDGAPGASQFSGVVEFIGDTAVLNSTTPLQMLSSETPNTVLPTFAYDMPTVLPTGSVAHLNINEVLKSISFQVDGTVSTLADGTQVPEPATLASLAGCLVCCGLRGRRRKR
jgi:hypothetical protein